MMNKKFLDSKLFLGFTNSSKSIDKGRNIYIGIGVCTKSTLSKGIPFDILSMVLCSEKLRRIVGAEKVFYIIADTHAMLTGHDANEILPYTMRLSALLENTFKEWNIPHVNFIASHLQDISYSSAYDIKPSEKYMQAEIEDMYYFIKNHNVGYKLGWRYDKRISVGKISGFDEWHFDKQARTLNIPLQFFYISPGHTMSEDRAMVSPYVCLNTKDRIIFNDTELNEKLQRLEEAHNSAIHLYRQYLFDIQYLYCQLFSKPMKGLKIFITQQIKQLS